MNTKTLLVGFLTLGLCAATVWPAGSTYLPVALGPKTLSGFGGVAGAHEFILQSGSSWKGDLTGIGAGPTWSLVVLGIDSTNVTGPADRFIYFNLQDADSGSHFKNLGINFYLDATGAGGGSLFQCYQQWTSEGLSSHGLNPGDLTASDFDLRFDFTKANTADPWTMTPYFRLSGGSWTIFNDGGFSATVGGIDFDAGKLIVGFDGGADGALSFDNYYMAGISTTYVNNGWSGKSHGEYVEPGKIFGVNAFATIQDGVDGVSDGGTVIVNEGTGDYAGGILITKPGLTVTAGSNPVIDVASGVGIEVHDTAPNTVIDDIDFIDSVGGGVAIQNGSSNYGWDGGTGLEVRNCNFDTAQAIDGFADDLYFHDNVCNDSDWNDIFGEGDNPVIVHNTLTNTNQSSILLWVCDGGVIADNVISGSGTTLYGGTDFGGGISVIQATGLSITANMITGLVNGAAIGFQWDGGADVIISGNVLDTSKLAGIHFGEDSDDDLVFWLSNNLYVGGGAMLDFRPSVGSDWNVDLNYELTLSQADQGASIGNSISLLRPKTSDDVGWEINFSGSSYTVDTDSDEIGDASYTGFLGDPSYTAPPGNPYHAPYPDPGWVVGTTRDDITWTEDAFNNYGLDGAPDAETGAPIVNHDPWPTWPVDVPDADDDEPTGAKYAFSSSFDPLAGDSGVPDNTWSVTYWDQGEFEVPSLWYQRVHTGTIDPGTVTVMAWRGDGGGGVKDMLHHRSVLIETGGNWIFPSHAEDFFLDPNTWLDTPKVPENANSTFLLDIIGYEVDGTTGFPNQWIIEGQLVPNENILSIESRADAAPGSQIVVQPGGVVDVFLYVQKLDQPVNGCQVYLGFNAGMLNLNPADINAAGDVSLASPWMTLVYADVIGDAADAAVGLELIAGNSTQADAIMARLRFTAGTVEGTTRVFFKKNDGLHETLITGYPNSNSVIPSRIDSEPIVIDGTAPVVEVLSTVPDPVSAGTMTTIVTAADALSGVVSIPTVSVTPHGGAPEDISIAGTEVSPGVFEYAYTVTGATNNGVATVDASATDYAGNTGNGSGAFFIDTVDPNVAVTSVKQGGGLVCDVCDCTPPAIQGVMDIEITATDATPSSGLATFPMITVMDAAANPMPVTGPVSVVGSVYTYQVTVLATTANGTAQITADVCDNAGNCAIQATDSFCINKTTITATVEHEGMVTTGKIREITFLFTDGVGDPDNPGSGVTILGTVVAPVTFNTDTELDGNGEGVALLTAIPNGTTHISAKAADHTLRSKVQVTIDPVNAQNTAPFMDTDMLLGGDLNNDNKVNLTDYSILATNYLQATDTGDINGSGAVNLTDYMILADNYFKLGDAK